MQPKLERKQQIGKNNITKNSDKGTITQIYKELNQMCKKSSHSKIVTWVRDMNRQFSDKKSKLPIST